MDIMSDDFFSISEAEHELLSMLNAKTVKTYSLDRRTTADMVEPSHDPSIDFGPHYMITVCDTEMTMDWIYKWLDTLAPKINMEAITRPYVIYSTVNDPKYISGVLVVAQSHVAVHYNIAEKMAYIDIFSCSFLKNEHIESVLKDSFGDKASYKLYVRGSKHEYSYQNSDARSEMFAHWQKLKID